MKFSIKQTVGFAAVLALAMTCPEWLNGGLAYGQQSSNKETQAQSLYARAHRLRETPRFIIKTNLLYDLATSPNIGVEFKLARKLSFEIPFTMNPWVYDVEKNMKFKFALIQPELRIWTCEVFNGHFFGLHGHYAVYNVGGMPNPPFSESMNLNRYEGRLWGAGISYGFQWIIGARWNMEFEIGGGYAKLNHDKYPCITCIREFTPKTRDYWGVTRLGLSLVHILF